MKIWSYIFMLILLIVSSEAATITIQYNASNAVQKSCFDFTNNTAPQDNNFATYGTTSGVTTGYCFFNYTKPAPAISSSIWYVKDCCSNVWLSLPNSCLAQNPIQLKISTYLNPFLNSSYEYCWNSTNWILQHGTGAGNSNNNYFYEQVLNLTFDNETSCLGRPVDPIYAYDDFSYNNYVNSCYWTTYPYYPIAVTSGELCWGSPSTYHNENFEYRLDGEGNFYGYDVFSEEFDLTLTNDTTFEKDFQYLILATGASRMAYSLSFWSDLGNTYIQFIDNNNTGINLCSDCWSISVKHHYLVTMYGPDASGYTFLNSTNHQFQAIKPNTYALQIDNGPVYANLPIIQPSIDHSNIPRRAAIWLNYGTAGSFCLDNYKLTAGLISQSQILPNITLIPNKQLGEPCIIDSECYTGLCNYLKACQQKGFNADCLNNYECMSNKCVIGKCSNPSLWQLVDNSKTELIGNDTSSNNLIAIILSLVFAAAFIFLGVYAGAEGLTGFIGGIAGFYVAMIFFTMVGWLSPFILVGLIVATALIVTFTILLNGKG